MQAFSRARRHLTFSRRDSRASERVSAPSPSRCPVGEDVKILQNLELLNWEDLFFDNSGN
jgi:hypothetical protein